VGFFDDIGDAFSDAADAVGDVASDVGEAVVDAADAAGSGIGEAGEWFAGASGDLGAGLGSAIDWTATALDDASFGMAGSSLNFLDDTVFDTVDYLSGGVVDVDFDDGTFSAAAGIDGIMSYGASVGEHGVTASYGTLVATGEAGLTDQGFNIGASGGIDFGPLPYAEGHIDLDANGTVSIGGEAQGTIPTPIGFVSGDLDGGFSRTPDGAWAGNLSVDGQLTLPSGTYVGGSFDVAHQQTADGDSITSVGVGGSVGQYGVGEVGADIDYTHAEVDGVTLDQVSGSAHASGYGVEAGVEGGYQRVEAGGDVIETGGVSGHVSGYGQSAEGEVTYTGGTVGGQSFSDWSAEGSLDIDPEALREVSTSLFGEGAELPASADDLVGMLGAGGTGDLLGQLGGSQLSSFVGSLAPEAAQDLANKLIADGNFGSLLGGDGAAVHDLLGKVADAGGLGDVLGQLDPGTTANVVSTLATSSPSAMPTGAVPVADDVLGSAPPEAVAAPVAATTTTPDLTLAADPLVGEPVAVADVAGAAAPVDEMAPVPVVPEPVDEFTQQIDAADQAEESVDDLFEGI
jgi:hypothetical protein